MKNKNIKLLALGVLATVVMSSAPVFAATNTTNNLNNKSVQAYSITKLRSYSNFANRMPFLSKRDTGIYVKDLQRCLNYLSFPNGISVSEDGIFGDGTYNAVRRLQRANGISDDGMVGPRTWAKLEGAFNGIHED